MDLIGIITKDVDDKIIIIGLELLFLFNKQFFFCFVFFSFSSKSNFRARRSCHFDIKDDRLN